MLGTVILLGLSVFQLLLALGAPLGEYAWGGQHRVLPVKLRIASTASIGLYAIFAMFLVSKVGVLEVTSTQPVLDIGIWIFAIYFTLGIVMNALSRSKKERMVMTPLVTMLAFVFWAAIALG